MKSFPFGKKGDSGGDEDSTRSALFGNRKKASPAPSASSNPYAQPPPPSDPYAQTNSAADPYGAPDNNKYGGMGRPFADRGNSYGSSGPDRANSYGGAGAGRGVYGGGGGDRYGGADGNGGSTRDDSGYGSGGYGGLGRAPSYATVDANRDELFAGAKDRYAQRQVQGQLPPENGQPGGGYGQDDGYSSRAGQSGVYGGASSGGYGEQRELTAEEQEEEDIQTTKDQIRFMKREDVSSTRNALRIAAQAEETGRNTLARLGAQGERIHNTEKNLDLASNHNRVAEARAKELKTLNRSMFAVHVANPFTAKQRDRKRDDEVINKHQDEREQRELTRAAAFGSQARIQGAMKEQSDTAAKYRPKTTSLAERSKYQFEADSEDDEMENEIDANLDALGGAAGRLNLLAKATGEEVDHQNKHIDRIITKSDKVDDQIAMNRARLNRIR